MDEQEYSKLAKRFGELTLKEDLSPEEKIEYQELKNKMSSYSGPNDNLTDFLDSEPKGN